MKWFHIVITIIIKESIINFIKVHRPVSILKPKKAINAQVKESEICVIIKHFFSKKTVKENIDEFHIVAQQFLYCIR